MTRRIGAALVAALTLVALPVRAQRQSATLGAGFVSVRYADAPGVTLGTLSPAFSRSTSRAALDAGGTFSFGEDGTWSAQGVLSLSRFTAVHRGWLGEFSGTGGGSSHSDGARTGQLLGSVRAHRVGARLGGWLGAGVGAMHDGTGWGSVQQAELGIAATWTRATLLGILTPTRALDSLRYADARAVLTVSRGAVEYRASFGARLGDSLRLATRDQRLWGDVGVTAWIAPRLAVVAAAGTYPVDPTQGFPSGRFASLAVRFGGSRPAPALRSATDDRARADAARAGVETFESRRLADGRLQLRVRTGDAARRVELSGDLTAWQPVAMRREGRWWLLEVAASAGVHECVLRVDGGDWVVPPGLPVSRDEFGGLTGILVLP